jgi:elongation factor 3
VLTEEEKAQLEVEFVGKNGQKRKIEMIMGRSKLKKGFQYEIKWRGSVEHVSEARMAG